MANKILIVDDDVVITSLLEVYLKSLSFQIEIVSSGEKCIEALRSSPDIDVIIMDFQLPDSSAVELLAKLNELNLICGTKIIIASGNEKSQQLIEAQALRADAYLLKPFTPQEIYNQIKNLTC